MCGNQPLVSIIITTYKRHDYLQRAIESALHQTYKNIELIVVDDNDEKTEYSKQVKSIVERIQIKDKRIQYIPMGKNTGACAARNRGFECSKGEYIDFLDDDDEFMPNKIQKQLEKFDRCERNIGSIGCFAIIKNEKGEIVQYDRNRIRGDVFFENLCHSLCQTSIPLIKRKVFEKSGGFENIISSQEHLMLAKLFSVCPYYDYVEEELVVIHHHKNERISNSEKKPLGAIELSERFKRYYPRLSDGQIKILEQCMYSNIINAYILVGKRKEAIMYYIKKKNNRDKFTKEDAKLLFGIVFGSTIKATIHRMLLLVRRD